MTLSLLFGGPAHAGPAETREALDRMGEILELRLEEGRIDAANLRPAILIEARARYSESEGWFTGRTLEVLSEVLGPGALRMCEACTVPRAWVDDGNLTYQAGPTTLGEILRLDDQYRGASPPARSAIWVLEHPGGVSVRILDLRTGAVLYAQNIDPTLLENRRSQRTFRLSEEMERRARGDSLTHAFFDVGIFPGQHLSIDWADQFGRRNEHLAGVTISVFDPVIGVGPNYAWASPFLNTLIGGKVIVSLPTAFARAISEDLDQDLIDPLLTGVFTARLPIARSNYGILGGFSTNGRVFVGISLMNISSLPVIP
jgi:hypothetical protein